MVILTSRKPTKVPRTVLNETAEPPNATASRLDKLGMLLTTLTSGSTRPLITEAIMAAIVEFTIILMVTLTTELWERNPPKLVSGFPLANVMIVRAVSFVSPTRPLVTPDGDRPVTTLFQ